MRVQAQCMVGDFKAFGACNAVLAFFNLFVKKLFHPTAVKANQVVVVLSLVEFIHRFATFELTAGEQARLFKLHQHAIDGGQSDICTFLQHEAVNIFCAHVALPAFLEQLQYRDAR